MAESAPFLLDEKRRYGRQMVLAEVGLRGQIAWHAGEAEAHDRVEALYLAAAGIGRLRVPDEETARAVCSLNPHVVVTVGSSTHVSDVQSSALRALTTLCALLPK